MALLPFLLDPFLLILLFSLTDFLQVLFPVVLDQPLVLALLLLRFRGEVLWAEGHRFDTVGHLSVAGCDCYVLKEVLKLLSERYPSKASDA